MRSDRSAVEQQPQCSKRKVEVPYTARRGHAVSDLSAQPIRLANVATSGLAGYFEAVLYGTIGLSIHPERKDHVSKDMLSWFPLFFPFRVSDLRPIGICAWHRLLDGQGFPLRRGAVFTSVPLSRHCPVPAHTIACH